LSRHSHPPTVVHSFRLTSTPATHTLSLHDALPIFTLSDLEPYYDRAEKKIGSTHRHGRPPLPANNNYKVLAGVGARVYVCCLSLDRKSTRLNSSHVSISYAVFCLIKKKKIKRANK